MRILVVTPQSSVRTGNHWTAEQWAEFWRAAGHDVVREDDDAAPDVIVTLHAVRTQDRARQLRAKYPAACLIVVLTGTDLYPTLSDAALETLGWADRIVVLQSRAVARLPASLRTKARVVVQSVPHPAPPPVEADPSAFEICCVGHVRPIKDTLRPALAARELPESSRIRIVHAGDILDESMRAEFEREVAENDRYEWLGPQTTAEVATLLARCHASVLPSLHEGGARVLGESIVAGTPVIAARNDATLAFLGESYPALFTPGDTEELAALLSRFENDAMFRADLERRTRELAPVFEPARERTAWAEVLAECACTEQGARDAV